MGSGWERESRREISMSAVEKEVRGIDRELMRREKELASHWTHSEFIRLHNMMEIKGWN